MQSTEKFMLHHYPKLSKLPKRIRSKLFRTLEGLFHEKEINSFLENNSHKDLFGFIEAVLEYFNISIGVKQQELERIPSYGKVVIIANHPLGALDSLALIDVVKDVRKDIKVVANSFLSQFENLSDILISVDNIKNKTDKKAIMEIYEALNKQQAVIIFPSGEVSRAKLNGIKDTKWRSGFLKIAKKTQSPILPIYIKAKNSKMFYMLSWVNKSVATATLPHEMFKSFKKNIDFRIGNPIAFETYNINGLDIDKNVKLIKKHFYKIAKGKKEIFETQNPIAHAEQRQDIKQAIKNATLLGKTFDNKQILLYDTDKEDSIIKEIGRLREISFRFVGEGSGKRRDVDEFDRYYKHIIVWDDEALEIAGAYRIGIGSEILKEKGFDGLYTSKLFNFSDAFKDIANLGVELGRSFVQPKYWNSRALDYLWQGIGAFLKTNPDIRYLFGAVSISDTFNDIAKAMMIDFYTNYFGAKTNIVTHKYPYIFLPEHTDMCKKVFVYNDYKKDLQALKDELGVFNLTIPTLYKQYSELCEDGGVKFYDFGLDVDFGNCIDGFIVADITLIKDSKRKRYLE
ncbi:MAG: lysophospholipid acyltransferase family protein [Sulfurovaceae bacterium]|nr:lysophospholipid acyltransferase family protein [Sulfurovaceae bacterium]MDD5548539.1 lysophospholipid acyltransferase family protein [Sulfurovaceae bacterium]